MDIKFFKYLLLIIFLSPLSSASASVCDGLMNTKDVSFQYAQLARYKNVFDASCETTQNVSRLRAGFDSEALIKKIPVSFTGFVGTDKEKMSNFCKTYKSWESKEEQRIDYTEKFSERQLQAVEKCLLLESDQTYIEPIFFDNTISITLRQGRRNPVLQSVAYPEDEMTCQGSAVGLVGDVMRARLCIQ